MKIWMKVSKDKYELPEAFADTAVELAELCGTTANTIYTQCSKFKAGVIDWCPWVCVAV